MLSLTAQNEIFKKYCGTTVKKSLQENFSFESLEARIDNEQEFSNVVYVDISDFSNKVMDYTASEVKDYLNEYYAQIMPSIKKYNGQIDKIMGDGIIAVFSKVFPNIDSDKTASIKAFLCSKEMIENLYCSNFEAKVAIGSGKLFFCKTGVEQIYEEFTALGYPMTEAYRLESIAEKNQILLMRNTDLSKRIANARDRLNKWGQTEREYFLKGLNSKRIHILQY
jgi:hypothetical protein